MSNSDFSDVLQIEHLADAPIVQWTVHRPKALNAINQAVLEALAQAVEAIDDSVRAVVLTGAGDKAFVAGADIAAMKQMQPQQASAFSRFGQQVFSSFAYLDVPVIAAVNGFALGGGCELAMACDFIIASENAKFGQPETNLGLLPGFGGSVRLPRKIGVSQAAQWLMTGAIVDAAEAQRLGLVNEVVESAKLLERAHQLAAGIAKQGPLAVAACKKMLRENGHLSVAEGCVHEAAQFGALFATADMQEGVSAFLEKRKPAFKNC